MVVADTSPLNYLILIDQITLVASTPHWIVIHYAAALAAVSTVVAIALFLRTVNDARVRAIGEAGKYTAALGAAVFLVAIMVDGYGFPHFAAQWMAAEPAEKLMVLWAASAVQTVDVALFPVWAGVFLGIGIVLVSFAIWYSNEYSRALAVLGIAGATMCFVYALSRVFGFRIPLWPWGPAVDAVWLTWLGIAVLRKSSR